ncbi:LmbE family N-acetylglucosaminyl deacetylase [Algoriphagus iocasae]|uniref:LmbE family N-acetylglucosaminyl deacetylase n=1 Tax=Algoriphagus iocasae TaxID=1836499 RepID=A0A841MUN0_9BACT|nr:PIG-L family deacetylase [Algoriphagus iocasae]MBB6325721.1 LmbE family N-acetylglucosaminyl deacetylase [Algoriphagus iocasae]
MTKSKIFATVSILAGLFVFNLTLAQSVPSSKLYQKLLQLKETRRVLYVAAHPDDENTRLISYLANGENLQVAYLSLTRGDGGQNLIGKELSEKLGQIRTQELLQARKTDGGRQFFSRAIDFGYTKTPDETFQNWDREKILSDVVWVIRNFQPDIIITRFNTTPGGGNHGQHTTSAIMAGEAMRVSGDPKVFPEQLKYVDPWKPKRVFWNTYNFRGEFKKEEGIQYFEFPTGDYNPLLGETYSQIAADSRTMHKSQGFGSTATNGEATDYIQFVEGEAAVNSEFDGVKNRWETIDGGKEVEALIDQTLKNFDFTHPENNISSLLQIKEKLDQLDAKAMWVEEKKAKIDELILESLGVEAEWIVRKELGYAGESVETTLEITNPTDNKLELKTFGFLGQQSSINQTLGQNKLESISQELILPKDTPLSQPYWLKDPSDGALYHVRNQLLIGKPFENDQIKGILNLSYEGEEIALELPLMFKYNSPVDGEVKQPFTVVTEVDLVVSKENVFLVEGVDPKLTVTVNFANEMLDGKLGFENLTSSQYKIVSESTNEANKQKLYEVEFSLDANQKRTVTATYTTTNGEVFDQSTNRIIYSHIPNLTYFSPASVNLIKADWKISGAKIGYVPGAGDDVPSVLSALGYEVVEIGPNDFNQAYLSQFKAVVVGIRAYNTNLSLIENQQVLMDYVKEGGNVVVQYNTTGGLKSSDMGPYPFSLSRDRVTVENSPFKADYNHPVLSTPNQLVAEDFDGWVQERGLYFVTDISKEYSTPLQFQDPDEDFLNGSLIYTKYGKGNYVYTSISFFRELPAGVPGAIKLFINLIEQ